MNFRRTEADIQRAILAHCNRLAGVTLFRVNSGAVTATYKGKRRFVRFTGMPGISDLIGWRTDPLRFPGCARFLAIEVKRPGGTLTALQAAFLKMVRIAGGLAIVASSVEDVIEAFRNNDSGRSMPC